MNRVVLAIAVVLSCVSQLVWGVAGYWEIPMTDRDLKIDGLVTPRERSVCSVTTFTVLGALKRPQYETTVYACATREGVYFGFVCFDPHPQSLVTSVTVENGPVMKDDSVEFVLCPALVGERDNYFHFAMNAAGVRYSWDASFDRPVQGWLGKAAVTPVGWEAEFFIPYSVIRGRRDLSHWRANFMRMRPARGKEKEEISTWVDPGMTIHNYKKFGFLRFVEPKEESIEELLRQLMELRMQEMTEQLTTGTAATTGPAQNSFAP